MVCVRLERRSDGPVPAEDAVQEVFFRAWTKHDTFTGRSSFFTWLYRLAINTIIRGKRRWVSVRHEDVQERDPVDPVSSPDEGKRDAAKLWDLRELLFDIHERRMTFLYTMRLLMDEDGSVPVRPDLRIQNDFNI